MKNITPNVNRNIFENFYKELYHLLGNQLRVGNHTILIKPIPPPPRDIGPSQDRLMLRDL